MVRAKKHLGQHFLKDQRIADRIAGFLTGEDYNRVLEIGPGTGVLTRPLLEEWTTRLTLIELDRESVNYLHKNFEPGLFELIEGDVLKMDLSRLFTEPYGVAGNFPYNISSQIFFKILEHRHQVMEVVCMLQKEVAERLVSPPGNKDYGILSVLLQAYYNMEYLFTVNPEVFDPPPRVMSGVIRLKRNEVHTLDCDEKLFKNVVKQGFQFRRKTLRNALKALNLPLAEIPDTTLAKRAEQLSVTEFVELTKQLQSWKT